MTHTKIKTKVKYLAKIAEAEALEKWAYNIFSQSNNQKVILSTHDIIDRSFVWSKTPEGHEFWYELEQEMYGL